MKVLKQRNNLLKEIQKDASLKETLFIWDSQLAQYGRNIIKNRKKFVDELSYKASLRHKQITSSKEELSVLYNPSVDEDSFDEKLFSYLGREMCRRDRGS